MDLGSFQNRRTWIVASAVVAVLVAAMSWFLVILPKLGDANDDRTQARDNDFANTQLLARHGALVRQQKNLPTLRANLETALAALPPTSAIPEFTNEMTKVAAASAVTLQNISVGALAPVTPSTATTPTATTPTDAASGSTATPAASTSSSATPAATTSTPSQYQLSITLSTRGAIGNQLQFLKAVENGSRRALISSTTFSGLGSKLVLNTQLNIFTAPMSAAQVAQLRTLLAAS